MKTGGNLTALRLLYAVFLIGTAITFGFQLKSGHWLQTDLHTLLPQEQHWSAIQQQADKLQEIRLNQQIIALVGNTRPEQAFSLAEQIAAQWQQSGLFRQIDSKIRPDLNQLKNDISALSFALLPEDIRRQLIDEPQRYFHHYAEQIANPFAQTGLLSPEQDWLGFGRFVITQPRQLANLQWNAENGMIHTEHNGITWVMIHGTLTQNSLLAPQQTLLDLAAQSRNRAAAAQSEFLITGTSLFAAITKQQAENESTQMGILGAGLTLILLLGVFRTLRVLWLFLPIGIGMLCGVTATILGFGQIHILTLVVGTSLIGVLIDFPLHWLASSLFNREWNAQRAMEKLRFTFFISLLVTLLGYGLLGFTVLPVLQQTALFSAVALLCAMLTTLLWLPKLFSHYQPDGQVVFQINATFSRHKKSEIAMLFGFALFVVVGLFKSKWEDDIRQWIAIPPPLLQQARQISEITGIDLGSQYFLVTAENDEALLKKEKNLTALLQPLQQQGKLRHFYALSQWIMPQAEQQALAERLARTIRPQDYAILQELGVPAEKIRHSLDSLPDRPLISLQEALNTQPGQGWRSLYLGELSENRVAATVKVTGAVDTAALAALADGHSIYWQDKRTHLNKAFQQTRDQAVLLKLISFILAGLLLWRCFGFKNTLKMLTIPLFAILSTIAVFGWLNIPVSLFAMFGLLLVSAIGIDYTAYMHTAREPSGAKRTAILLACATTLISFVLLSLSSTPAVAAFGMSVCIGVLFSVIATFRILC